MLGLINIGNLGHPRKLWKGNKMTPKKMKKLRAKWREIINNPPMDKTLPKGIPFILNPNLADKFIGNFPITKDRLLFKLRERMFEIEKMQNRLDEPFQSEWEQIFAAVIRIEEGK